MNAISEPMLFAVVPPAVAGAVMLGGVRVGRTRIEAVHILQVPVSRSSIPAGRRARLVAIRGHPDLRILAGIPALGVAASMALGGIVPTLVSVPIAGFVARLRRHARDARREIETRCAVAEFATTMVGELRAGHPPGEALCTAAEAADGAAARLFGEVAAVVRAGGDVPGALAAAAREPGADALARIAACWRIAAERGAGFAAALDRIAAGLRNDDEGHRELEAELAGVRATARLLAGLPLLGVLLGTGMGAAPLDVLGRTPLGAAVLCAGLALLAGGLVWTERIAEDARRSPCPG
ncbi:hypothetical protein GCM10023205_52120 [Yinghuangia aomiensis]|uniref:Type II secretion system protein GspF domain-containing protein n=1 Tax=Yinghuangia aomiensis TaxID=676205 RepID=A0ABP9HU70_9ACTN